MSPSISFTLTVGILFCFAFFFFSVSNAASLPPVVSKSVLLGNITDPNHTNIGHDGGYSGVVSGHSVWLFDDTQQSNPFGFWSNYAAVGNVKNPLVLNGSVGQVALGFTANEQQFNDYWCNHNECGAIRYAVWPNSSPVQIGTNNGAVFADRVYVNASAKNMYVSAGVAAYNFTVGNGYPKFTRVGDEQFWTMANPKYGSAATLNIKDGYVYLYAYSTPLMFVARVPPKSVFDKSKYQFYNGKTGVWSSTIPATNDSSSAIMYDYIGSVTIFHSAYYGAYLMVYCQWDNVIRVKSAPQPWGPFTGGSDLYTAGAGPNGFTYSCAAHPEYSNATNELYLSYTWQGSAGYQNRVAKVTFQ